MREASGRGTPGVGIFALRFCPNGALGFSAAGATGATGSYTPGNYGATGGYTPSYTSSDSYNSHPTMGVPQAPMTQQPAQPAYYAPQQPAQQQYAGGATGPMPSVQPQQPKRPTTDANGVPSFMKRRGN